MDSEDVNMIIRVSPQDDYLAKNQTFQCGKSFEKEKYLLRCKIAHCTDKYWISDSAFLGGIRKREGNEGTCTGYFNTLLTFLSN